MTSTLHLGDCLDVLRAMADASVHCCVTSPPYWGLRDYGHDGQIGMEATPEEYVARMVEVFREVRRVLRDDGTLWLNLGDSYNAYNANRGASTSISDGTAGRDHPKHRQGLTAATLKNKDLVGIPWRVAFALQSDGWYLRQDIIWHKPNSMPESVTDRCTKAHEYVFLLSKSARYYYDADAIKEPASSMGKSSGSNCFRGAGHFRESAGGPAKRDGRDMAFVGRGPDRNRRDVWTIATKPFNGAHFAVMPPELVEPCILAGCPKGGVVYDPFTGSGTVGEQALLLGRDFEGSEINPAYHAIAQQRISKAQAAGHQPDLFASAGPVA
jgi:DNA modification methylase